jgi:hypothetical protein
MDRPFRANLGVMPKPWALPWAGMGRTVGAETARFHGVENPVRALLLHATGDPQRAGLAKPEIPKLLLGPFAFACFRTPRSLGQSQRLGSFRLRLKGTPAIRAGFVKCNKRDTQAQHQCRHHRAARRKSEPVPAPGLLEAAGCAGRPGEHRLVVQVPLQVGGEAVGRVVAALTVLLQTLHHDPVEVAAHAADKFLDGVRRMPSPVRSPAFRRLRVDSIWRGGTRGPLAARRRTYKPLRQPRAGSLRLLLANRLAHRVEAGGHQLLRVERRAPGQEFVEHHAQAVDVTARVNVQPAHLRLLRTHGGRRANELMQLCINRRVGQATFGCFRDAEINHLWHRHPIVQRDEDVRRLDVAVDDALLVRVLNRVANFDEQIKPFLGVEIGLVAVVGDADAARQFHHEVGAAARNLRVQPCNLRSGTTDWTR